MKEQLGTCAGFCECYKTPHRKRLCTGDNWRPVDSPAAQPQDSGSSRLVTDLKESQASDAEASAASEASTSYRSNSEAAQPTPEPLTFREWGGRGPNYTKWGPFSDRERDIAKAYASELTRSLQAKLDAANSAVCKHGEGVYLTFGAFAELLEQWKIQRDKLAGELETAKAALLHCEEDRLRLLKKLGAGDSRGIQSLCGGSNRDAGDQGMERIFPTAY